MLTIFCLLWTSCSLNFPSQQGTLLPYVAVVGTYKNEKLCKQLRFKASLGSAPLLKISIISHYNTEAVYYKILHLHHWSHLGLIPIKQKTAMATVFLSNPQVAVTNPKQGRQTGMSKEHHCGITPIPVTGNTGRGGREFNPWITLLQCTPPLYNLLLTLFSAKY